MFILSVLIDSIKIAPCNFGKEFDQAIRDELNGKYANKVVKDLGLAICLFDLEEILEDPLIYPGTEAGGSVVVKVQFSLVVFRAFIGEVLTGKIKHSTPEGIVISLDFFDDILLPPQCMAPNTRFDVSEQLWVWEYQDEPMYLDTDESIRFRVLQETFLDIPPIDKTDTTSNGNANSNSNSGNGVMNNAANATNASSSSSSLVKSNASSSSIASNNSRNPLSKNKGKSPYSLIVTIAEDGLGLEAWWPF